MILNKILRFGLMKRFRSGIRVHFILTFACNFDCYYCTWRGGGGYPKSDIMRFDKWKEIIDNFPLKIQEVTLTGGEPMLHPDFVQIVKYLLSKGIYVSIWTNLSLLTGLELPKTHRLRFDASRHSLIRKLPFYDKEYKDYNLSINDVGQTKNLNKCYLCQTKNPEKYHKKGFGICYCHHLFVCPDGQIMTSFYKIARHYS